MCLNFSGEWEALVYMPIIAQPLQDAGLRWQKERNRTHFCGVKLEVAAGQMDAEVGQNFAKVHTHKNPN